MMMAIRALCISLLMSGCAHINNTSPTHEDIKALIAKSESQYVEELSREIAIFENVAFGLGLPLRRYLNEEQNVKGKMILDLGTGSGVLSLIALKNGARKSVATEINQYAVANVAYNAELLGFRDKMDVRLVPMDKQGAYSVIVKDERFDLIVSNPPQHHEPPTNIYEYSYADPKLAFLRSILEGLNEHLSPSGKGVFALYDQGLELANQMSREHDFDVNVLLETNNRNGACYLVEIRSRQGQVSELKHTE